MDRILIYYAADELPELGFPENFHEHLVCILENNDKKSCPFEEAKFTEEINGEVTLEFRVPASHPDAAYVRRGYWAVIQDEDEAYRAFSIEETEEIHEAGEMYIGVFCEDLSVVEMNDEIIEDIRPQNTDAGDALERALGGSVWEVGQVDDLGTGSTNFYYETVRSAVNKVIKEWGGEVRYRVELGKDNRIVGRYVDLFAQRGEDTGKRFEYSKDLVRVKRTTDLSELKTALYGRGKGEETEEGGHGRRLTFADVEWSTDDGDPVDKPEGQEWVGDPYALFTWGRTNHDGTRRHRFGIYKNEDQDDPEKLLEETWAALQEINRPRVTYEMDVVDLERLSGLSHEAVRIGDTVWVIDHQFRWDVAIQVRVVKIVRYLNEPEKTEVTLGDRIPEVSDSVNEVRQRTEDTVRLGDPVNWLDTAMETLEDELRSTPGYFRLSQGDGILVTDKPLDQDPTSFLQLKGGILAIANEIDPNTGEPNWRAFGDGDGFTADLINAGTLNADRVSVETQLSNVRLTLRNGNMKTYYDGKLTLDVGGYSMSIYDHGIYDPEPDYSRTGSFALAWSSSSDDGEGEYSRRGVTMMTMKDFISIGKGRDNEDGSFSWQGNFHVNWTDPSTEIVGPSTDDLAVDEYNDMVLGVDRRYRDQGKSLFNGPSIRLHRGDFDGTGNLLADVQVYVGDLDTDPDKERFQVFHNVGDGDYEMVFGVYPNDNEIWIGNNGSKINYAENDKDGPSLRFYADSNTYQYIGGQGRYHWLMGDPNDNYNPTQMMRLEPSGDGATLQVKNSDGDWVTLV